jgi:RsiW-degrading membrane proteinase PrsW (M82 family)
MYAYLLSIALALAPCIALGVFVYWRDKFDKEPLRLLAFSFLLGVFSCVPAFFGSLFLDKMIQTAGLGMTGLFIQAFFIIGLVEEGSKFLFTVLVPYRRSAFNEPYDGITYAVMVSLGFAAFENVLYVTSGGIDVAFLRMFTAVPAHVTFGVIMGYFLGLAKFKNNSLALKMMALMSASALHGFYDFSLFSTPRYPLMVLGAVLSLVLGVALSLRAIHLHRKNSPFNPASANYDNHESIGE